MNGKIYLIIEGEYSDWKIQGYHTDEEEALLICKKHNDSLSGAYKHLAEWYVASADHINASAEDKAKCDFVYSFTAALEDSNNWYLSPIPKCVAKGLEKSSTDIKTHPYSHKSILQGKIVLDSIDDLKAMKIMFDMIARAKAEIEGII